MDDDLRHTARYAEDSSPATSGPASAIGCDAGWNPYARSHRGVGNNDHEGLWGEAVNLLQRKGSETDRANLEALRTGPDIPLVRPGFTLYVVERGQVIDPQSVFPILVERMCQPTTVLAWAISGSPHSVSRSATVNGAPDLMVFVKQNKPPSTEE